MANESIFSLLREQRLASQGSVNEGNNGGNTEVIDEEIQTILNDESLMEFLVDDDGESLDESTLSVTSKGIDDKGLLLVVNGKEYHYTSTDGEFTPEELEKKYLGIAKHSIGKALAWIKKHAKASESYKKTNESASSEIVMVACPHCGILEAVNESGESEIEECPYCGEEELVEKVVKVVRDGEVVKKKVRTKKTRLTSAQKAALAKARKKAHTASAEKARKKSNKIRDKKSLNDEDYVECPECGWTGDISELVDGCCPECMAKINEACGKKNESVDEIVEAVNNLSGEDLVKLKKSLGLTE